MRLFGRKKEVEEPKELEGEPEGTLDSEMRDLDKLTLGPESNVPELPSELTQLKETATAEAEKITEGMEEPRLPEPVEEKREVELEEFPLKEFNKKVDEELKGIRKRMKDLGSLAKLNLNSPEMIPLMELYTEYKDKFNQFIDELNSMNLIELSSKRTFAAIYKFRACKTLSEIKREIRRIESICKDAGFIPTKVHEILESTAEDLVEGFLHKKSKKLNNKSKKK